MTDLVLYEYAEILAFACPQNREDGLLFLEGKKFFQILRVLDGFCKTGTFVSIDRCDDTLTTDGQAGDICALERSRS